MMRAKLLLGVFAFLLVASFAAQAELYRWTDKEGRVHYSDTPPPKDAVRVEEKQLRGNVTSGGDLPYALQEAMKKNPVRLYTSEDCGDVCKDGRALLNKRGVPFREIQVKDDASRAELKKLNDKGTVPVLAVGDDVRKGLNVDEWNKSLDTAGYPKTAMPGAKLPEPGTEKAAVKEPEPGPYTPR